MLLVSYPVGVNQGLIGGLMGGMKKHATICQPVRHFAFMLTCPKKQPNPSVSIA